MRRQLILGVVTSVLLTGLLIGIPLLVWSDLGLRRGAQAKADSVASQTVDVVERRLAEGSPVDSATLTPYFNPSRQVALTFVSDGRTDVYGKVPAGPVVRANASGPSVAVAVAEPVENTGSPVAVALRILATTLIAMFIAFLITRRRARTLADAFDEMAQDAARIGSGDRRPARRHRLPELDAIAAALDASSDRVNDMVRAERDLVADVTHQIRTPLTALSLRLEEIAEAGTMEEAQDEAREAHAQVIRLSGVIDDLIRVARDRDHVLEPVAVDEVVHYQAMEWGPIFAQQGRVLGLPQDCNCRVMAMPGTLSQVLATLLDNALVHGAGRVDIAVRTLSGLVVIEVSDEGAGVPPELGSRIFQRSVSGGSGSGLGLSLARSLAEQMGARLELVHSSPAVFAVFLQAAPTREDAPTSSAAAVAVAESGQAPDGGVAELEATAPAAGAVGSEAGNTQRR